MEVTHWGYFLSREVSKNTKLPEQEIYPFNISKPTIQFSNLPTKLKTQIKNILKRFEKKKQFAVEGFFLLDIKSEDIKLKDVHKAKIAPEYYPTLAIKLLKDGILNKTKIFKHLKIDYVDYWYSSRLKKRHSKESVFFEGESVSNGVGIGFPAFKRKEVKRLINDNKHVIWIAESISPDDIELLQKVQGVILTKAGASSHASILIKNLGLPFILCKDIPKLSRNQQITLDATKAQVFKGRLEVIKDHKDKYLKHLIKLASDLSPITVAANANNAEDVVNANNNGAKGIAVCRTEHMFLKKSKINLIRKILLQGEQHLSKYAEDLINIQYSDFVKILKHLDKSTIVIRFLDLPLYELMPNSNKEFKDFVKKSQISDKYEIEDIKKFKEKNSMMGYRAARFLINNPFFVKLQTRAILKAVKYLQSENISVRIGFELPLISTVQEVVKFKSIVESQIKKWHPDFTNYFYAAMIETPRACFISDKIAEQVDVISFGTNDLTQFTFAYSRDDTESFLQSYINEDIVENNPFTVLDKTGVGALIELSIDKARSSNPDIEVSICGEQATDLSTIKFLMKVGIDKIGCSPNSIPKTLFACAKFNTF